jgi:NAD(P) transhydrogenase
LFSATQSEGHKVDVDGVAAAMSDDFDLVVLGAGPAGEKGAAKAAYFGKRVAIVERELEPGGAAVHTGTLPSKNLREAALSLCGYRQRDLYGISVQWRPNSRSTS